MNADFFKKQDFRCRFIDGIIEYCNVCKKTFHGLYNEIKPEKFLALRQCGTTQKIFLIGDSEIATPNKKAPDFSEACNY